MVGSRVNPALAFRMMYPESCISFLCDTGRGHFDVSEQTARYISRFIRKALEQRLPADGGKTLKKVDRLQAGWYSAGRPTNVQGGLLPAP